MSHRRRWFRFWSRRDVDSELADEIGFHLERTISDLLEAGWSLPQAEREAYRRFGDVNAYRRRLRRLDDERWRMQERKEWFGNLFRDVGYAIRTLRGEPALALGVILTLALGIGANTTMFGIVDRLLLSPPEHVEEPDRLRRLLARSEFRGRTFHQDSLQHADFVDLQTVDGFESVVAWDDDEVTLGFGASARRIDAVVASASLFPTLGVEPALGRFYTPDEDRVGAPPTAVLGWEFWQGQYGGEEAALGETLEIAEIDYTIVGVAPEGFTGVGLSRVDVWLPLRIAGKQKYPSLAFDGSRGGSRIYWLNLVARLEDGVAEPAAIAEADALYQTTLSEREKRTLVSAPIVASRGPNASDESRVSLWLSGVSLVVLLVACANVANMLLARGTRRRGEIGVRLALGIPRSRLARQLLTESLLLASMGGVAALLVAHWGGGLVRSVLLPEVAWTRSVLSPSLLAITGGLALLTGLLAGSLPALQWSRHDVMESLKSGSRGSGGRSRTRSTLLVLQAALSVMLLTGAGLFVRSLWQIDATDLGLDDPEGLVVAVPEQSAEAEGDDAFHWPEEEILSRLRRHPGVRSATATITPPFGSSWAIGFELPDREYDELALPASGGPYINPVSSDYFETLGLRILRGRALNEGDREGADRVAVLNETMARLLWPDDDALGKCVLIGRGEDGPPPCTTVVGVVENATRNRVGEGEQMLYYVPLEQHRLDEDFSFLARLQPDVSSGAVVNDIREQILQAAPAKVRYVDAFPLQDKISPQARSWRLGAVMFTTFGLLAAVVAAIGLYGVLAFDVAQRTREIGVRSALGATSGRLRLLVLGRGVRLTAVGVGLGVLLALTASPQIEELLYEVSPRDPGVLGAVALSLLTIAAVASWLPALRATRVDPNEALRVE